MARGRKSRGLGDTIEKITTATGIKAAVDLFSEVTGIDCGCEVRKEKLNEIFAYKVAKPKCLEKSEYDDLTVLLKLGFFNDKNQRRFNEIFERVMQEPAPMTNCSQCMADRIRKIKKVYNLYGSDNI